jgi:hypothetical protein
VLEVSLFQLLGYLIFGYLMTVAIELPILLVGLGREHSTRVRVAAGFWLTACTYPVVVLVLPPLLWSPPWGSRVLYMVVAETFAPLAECLLFRAAFHTLSRRDALAILLANLASFATGEALQLLIAI